MKRFIIISILLSFCVWGIGSTIALAGYDSGADPFQSMKVKNAYNVPADMSEFSENASTKNAFLENKSGKTSNKDIYDQGDVLAYEKYAIYEDGYKFDRYIVKYKSDRKDDFYEKVGSKIEQSKKIKDAKLEKEVLSDEIGGIELITLKEKVYPYELAAEWRDLGVGDDIEYIQPDFLLNYAATGEGSQVNEDVVDTKEQPLSEKHTTPTKAVPVMASKTDKVLVAVIDTGMDIEHNQLVDKIWMNAQEIPDDGIDNDANGFVDDIYGWNFVDDNNEIYNGEYPSDNAHATHIAGIIAGVSDADKALAANQDTVAIMPLRVFEHGQAYTSDIINAIEYADTMGARIVNCSWGSTDNNPALEEAIENTDMLFVCAAGNSRIDLTATPIFPACFNLDNIISVASVNTDGGLSYFSNYSMDRVDIAALGRNINSTLPEGEYGLQSGTSMSAAVISGTAAAVLSGDDLSSNALTQRLIKTADVLSNLQETVRRGRKVNIDYALSDTRQNTVIINNPAADFDANGYYPTQSELFQLFSSGNILQVGAGAGFTVILMDDGTVWAWGINEDGQCGNGTISETAGISQVVGLTDIIEIAAGVNHCLALDVDGTVWGWGENYFGEAGPGYSSDYVSTPIQVVGLTDVQHISAGAAISLALKDDGTVRSWGAGWDGRLGDGGSDYSYTPVSVSNLTSVVQIENSYNCCFAIKSDGTVWGWGDNDRGTLGDGTLMDKLTPVQLTALVNVTEVAGGERHTLFLLSDGSVKACGENDYGQLGDGSTQDQYTPVAVSNLEDIIHIAAGEYHSLAIDSNGNAFSWGNNDCGMLGDGTTTTSLEPTEVSDITDLEQIAAGYDHSVALMDDGSVWSWGNNDCEQLGGSELAYATTPVRSHTYDGALTFSSARYWAEIPASGTTSLLVSATGMDNYGDVIDPWNITYSLDTPYTGVTINSGTGVVTVMTTAAVGAVDVTATYGDITCTVPLHLVSAEAEPSKVIQVSAGGYFTAVLKDDGTVWVWGQNDFAQCGNGTVSSSATLTQVPGLTDVVQISAGFCFCMALKSDGTVWTWGRNWAGELGDGGDYNHSEGVVQVYGLTGVEQVSAGTYHALALKSNGTVWAWGYGAYGQLGNGSTNDSLTAVQVSNLTNVTSIAAGSYSGYAVKADGTAWSWGANDCGQLGDGTTVDKTTPVQVSGLSGVSKIAGGCNHAMALLNTGYAKAWGSNDCVQLGNGSWDESDTPVDVLYLGDIADVAAGFYHSLAVDADGYAYCWGNNDFGMLGDGTTDWHMYVTDVSNITDIIEIDGGYWHSVALADDGTVWSWGNNTYAQLGGSELGYSTVPVQSHVSYRELYFANSNYIIDIPESGTNTLAVSAGGNDEYGSALDPEDITYSLETAYTGVTIDSETGVVTVTDTAAAGTVNIVATCEELTCAASLRLRAGAEERTLDVTADHTYMVSFSVNNVSSLTGVMYTVTYDDDVLEITDLCAFTHEKELTTGAIAGTGITITSFTDGEVSFMVDKTITGGAQWSGTLNIFEFKALMTDDTAIKMQ